MQVQLEILSVFIHLSLTDMEFLPVLFVMPAACSVIPAVGGVTATAWAQISPMLTAGNHGITQVAVISPRWHDRLNLPGCPEASIADVIQFASIKMQFLRFSISAHHSSSVPSFSPSSSSLHFFLNMLLVLLFHTFLFRRHWLSHFISLASRLRLDPDISPGLLPGFYFFLSLTDLTAKSQMGFGGSIILTLTDTRS